MYIFMVMVGDKCVINDGTSNIGLVVWGPAQIRSIQSISIDVRSLVRAPRSFEIYGLDLNPNQIYCI